MEPGIEVDQRDRLLADQDIIIVDTRTTPPRLALAMPSPSVQCPCTACTRRLVQRSGLRRLPLRPDLSGLLGPDPYVIFDADAPVPEITDRVIAYVADTRHCSLAVARQIVTGPTGFRLAVWLDRLLFVSPAAADAIGL